MMPGEITKTIPVKMGRPTVMTEEVVRKLEDSFRLGMKDNAAIAYAEISKETYYKHYRENEDFADRMETAKNYAVMAARQIIVKRLLDKDQPPDIELAKWYVEKHDMKQDVGVQNNTQVNVFNNLKDEYTKKPAEAIDDQVKKDLESPAPVQEEITAGEIVEAAETLKANE